MYHNRWCHIFKSNITYALDAAPAEFWTNAKGIQSVISTNIISLASMWIVIFLSLTLARGRFLFLKDARLTQQLDAMVTFIAILRLYLLPVLVISFTARVFSSACFFRGSFFHGLFVPLQI